MTGAVKLDEMDDMAEPQEGEPTPSIFEEQEMDANLTVDVFNTPNDIVIKAMVAGVKPDDLDVSISRDVVTIRGERSEEKTVSEDEYVHKELYWGAFSRTINLPEEVDVDESEATEKHGVLTLTLPKLDKDKRAKLKVRGG